MFIPKLDALNWPKLVLTAKFIFLLKAGAFVCHSFEFHIARTLESVNETVRFLVKYLNFIEFWTKTHSIPESINFQWNSLYISKVQVNSALNFDLSLYKLANFRLISTSEC